MVFLLLYTALSVVAASSTICALHADYDGTSVRFGHVSTNGSVTAFAGNLPQDLLYSGLGTEEQPNVFYYAANNDEDASLVTGIQVTSGTTMNTSTVPLQSILGYDGTPAIQDMNLDTARGQIVAFIQQVAPQWGTPAWCVLADVHPRNGSVGTVWANLTNFCNEMLYTKIGASTFDPKRGMYYLPGASNANPSQLNVYTIPLAAGGAGIRAVPWLPNTDLMALRYSATRDSVVGQTQRKLGGGQKVATVSYDELPADGSTNNITTLFMYDTPAFAVQLGMMLVDPHPGSSMAVAQSFDTQNVAWLSTIDLAAGKEVSRVETDPAIFLAVLEWCAPGS